MKSLTEYEMKLLQRMRDSLAGGDIELTDKEERDIDELWHSNEVFRKAYEGDPTIGPILRAMDKHAQECGVPRSRS